MRLNLKRLALIVAGFVALVPAVNAIEVFGAGASLPGPVYNKWSQAYQKVSGNKILYQSIGSGSGIAQIIAKSVDFGASDMPLSITDLEKEGLIQFPVMIGGVVPVVNLPDVKAGELKLTGPVLADIFIGKITKWNDKAITRLNSGVSLPDLAIAVVRRSDGAGSTFLFTNYLSKVSPNWKQKIGEGTAVQWTLGLGGKGDDGIATFVQRLPGSIGYVDYGYAKSKNLIYTQLQNQSGAFVKPDDASFKAAAVGASWERSAFSEILTEQSGKDAWPISGATFILMRRVQEKPVQGAEIIKFFDWAFKNGGKIASDSNYVPLPDTTANMVSDVWKLVRDPAGKVVAEMR